MLLNLCLSDPHNLPVITLMMSELNEVLFLCQQFNVVLFAVN